MGSQPDKAARGSFASLLAWFTLTGAFIGLAVGFWEARLIYFLPSKEELLRVDATYVIWFLAPAIDLLLYAGLGAALGCLAALAKVHHPKLVALLTAVLLSAAAAHATWSVHLLHRNTFDIQYLDNPGILLHPLQWFLVALALLLLIGRLSWRWLSVVFETQRARPLKAMARGVAGTGAVLVLGLIFYAGRPWTLSRTVSAGSSSSSARPNIVLVTLDTVRADHLSAYGYSRPTTPHLDGLASDGVLFENAIASASWTLPSMASIHTGLLPHQHGGNTFRPVEFSWVTLAEALRRRGYEAAGFNANYSYGQTGWGLGQGFAPYDDDRTTVKYNLARTVAGRTAVQGIYERLRHYDVSFRRNAGELNRDIIRWFRRRPSGQPYFLYINYFDAHAPYVPPPPYDRRFGKLSPELIRTNFRLIQQPVASLPPEQRASLVAGYDNALAYLDNQIGRLLSVLASSPDWSNTIVIVTADHGEAFGEHGAYDHGYDLHREEIHVPLIFSGPGIPAGKRVADVVPIRALFATVLDLALKDAFPLPAYSLSRYWNPQADADPKPAEVISELNTGMLSLTTSEWHYIHGPMGKEELYDRKKDPEEKRDLSGLPEYETTLGELRARLKDSLQHSLAPWLGPEYLYAFNKPEESVITEPLPVGRPNPELLKGPRRIGIAQALFNPSPPTAKRRLPPSREELLKSLPYQ